MENLLQNTTQLAQAIWTHYLSPQLASGAYAAVDATCGRGNDTVWLAARCGRVYAFDIQPDAIASTREALQAAGVSAAQILSQAQASQLAAGVRDVQALSQTQADGRGHKGSDRAETPAVLPAVTLIEESHANLAHYVSEPIGLIVFNLGYLPGADRRRAALCHHVLGARSWQNRARGRTALGGGARPQHLSLRAYGYVQSAELPAGDPFCYPQKIAGVSFRTG